MTNPLQDRERARVTRGPYDPVVAISGARSTKDHTPPDDPIVFRDPPLRGQPGRNQKWSRTIAALMERPGDWAKITTAKYGTEATNLGAEIRRGAGNWRRGQFEATVRGCDVYVRFVDES